MLLARPHRSRRTRECPTHSSTSARNRRRSRNPRRPRAGCRCGRVGTVDRSLAASVPLSSGITTARHSVIREAGRTPWLASHASASKQDRTMSCRPRPTSRRGGDQRKRQPSSAMCHCSSRAWRPARCGVVRDHHRVAPGPARPARPVGAPPRSGARIPKNRRRDERMDGSRVRSGRVRHLAPRARRKERRGAIRRRP